MSATPIIAALLLATAAALAQTPGYHFPGVAPGATGSVVTALSADGRTAAGASLGAFTWSEATGRYDLVTADFAQGTVPEAISDSGATLTGTSGGSRAIRWSGPA